MELLWDDDPEELLLELGFGCDEPDLSGRIPARFINYQSQARGINLQVFLEAQRSRIDLENPSVSNRFRQLEVLQEVSVAFSSLAGPLKGYKDMSPEARDRRKRMAMLFRKASKKSLSQLHNPIAQELTVATAHNPSAALLNHLEPEYGPEERKVTFRRVKLQDTSGLSPFVEEEDGTEAEVENGHTDTVRNPDGESRVGTLKDRFLGRVLQKKKSLQMRDSFEMEELGSFDDGGAAVEPAGTHFVRGLIRGNSCQSDSSGFLEDPLIPTVPQDVTPAPDLIKALSALSGGSTDSHSGDIPPVTTNGTPNTSPEDQRKEHLTGTPLNHFQIATETLNNDPSLQSTEQTPQESGALSPRNDLPPPEFKGTNSMSSDKNNLQSVLGMDGKTVYFVSSLKNQDSSNPSEQFQIPKFLNESVNKKENQSSIKKKPIVVTHFLSHEDSGALNENSEELMENDQDAMDVENVSQPRGSRFQSDVYLETDIDWQDVPQDVASVSCKDSVDDQNAKNEEMNAMKKHSVVSNPDDSRAQSHVYLETEIDFQDETQDVNFQTGQDPLKDTNTNNGETLKHNQDIRGGEHVVSIPNSSKLQSNVYLETEIDWQDMTQNSESKIESFPKGKSEYPKLEKSIPSQLIEIQSLDDVFETSVDASDVDDGDVEAFFQEMHVIGKVYWAEPIHISELASQEAGSFEALDTKEENYEMEMKPHQNVLPSTDESLWSNEKLFQDSMDFHNRNILNKSSVSLTSLDDGPSKHSISIQMLSNSTSHIVQRKDVPFIDNAKHTNVPRYFKLDTSNPFRAVQSWTNLHIQYNSNIFKHNVSNSAGSNLNRPVESYWSPYPLLDHGWQSDDCVHKTFPEYGSPTVSMDTGLWADGEDEEVDLAVGRSGQNGRNGQACRTCGRMCNCCKQDSQNTLSQKELEGILLYLKNFRSVLSLMEEQVTEEQTEVYSALTQQDRQCLEELLQLRQEVRQEALDLELQLSELVQHHDQSLTTNMWQLLNEQSLLCSQLQLCSPDHFVSLSMPRSGLVHKRTVATQCSPQLGPLHNSPLQVPRLPQTQTDSSHQGLGRTAAKSDKRHLVGLLHRLRDSMRH